MFFISLLLYILLTLLFHIFDFHLKVFSIVLFRQALVLLSFCAKSVGYFSCVLRQSTFRKNASFLWDSFSPPGVVIHFPSLFDSPREPNCLTGSDACFLFCFSCRKVHLLSLLRSIAWGYIWSTPHPTWIHWINSILVARRQWKPCFRRARYSN